MATVKNETIFKQNYGKNHIFGQKSDEKLMVLPLGSRVKKGRGYPLKRVVPGIRAVLVLPCPPPWTKSEIDYQMNAVVTKFS